MKIPAISNMKDINVNFISIYKVMEKLNVRRNYIYNRILPAVAHVKKGRYTYIDEESLRLWLKNTAEFSRQTVWIADSNFNNYQRKLPERLRRNNFGDVRNYSRKRSALPFRSVKPFDFWDMDLIHPALVVPKIYPTDEILYREMFLNGAIKITLGRNKTMFYLEENISEKPCLMPAIDEIDKEIPTILTKKQAQQKKSVNIIAPNCESESDANEIIRFFRERRISVSQFFYDRKEKNLHIEFNIPIENAVDTVPDDGKLNNSLFAGGISYDDIPF